MGSTPASARTMMLPANVVCFGRKGLVGCSRRPETSELELLKSWRLCALQLQSLPVFRGTPWDSKGAPRVRKTGLYDFWRSVRAGA